MPTLAVKIRRINSQFRQFLPFNSAAIMSSSALTFVLTLTVLLLHPHVVWAQKGNKPPGRNKPGGVMQEDGRGRREYELAALLPSGFQHLREEDVRQLELLSRSTLAWLRSTSAAPEIFPAPALLFHPGAVDVTADNTSGERLADAETRGLRILSLLELEQRKTLAEIIDEYRRDAVAWDEQSRQLIAAVMGLRDDATAAALRKLETDSRKPLTELARLDGDLALLQLRVFQKLAKTLSPKQSEAISLAILSSAVLETNTPEMQEVENLLRKTSADAARDLQFIAWNFGAWLSPPAIPGASAIPAATGEVGERRGGGRDRSVDPAVLDFLTVLRGNQHQLLLGALTAYSQTGTQSAAAQQALLSALRPTGSGSVAIPDQRTVRGLFQQRCRVLFSAAADRARANEAFRQSLSAVQKEHLGVAEQNQKKKPKQDQ